MHEQDKVYVGLGSNLGDRLVHLQRAVRALEAHPDISDLRTSPVYESEAHTLRAQDPAPAFLNAVAELATALSPEALLAYCQQLEAKAGRVRTGRWEPRPLDLDLLLYGRQRREVESLMLPHPRMGERRFVLQPLADLAPNLHVPIPFDDTVTSLLQCCPDTGELHRFPERLPASIE